MSSTFDSSLPDLIGPDAAALFRRSLFLRYLVGALYPASCLIVVFVAVALVPTISVLVVAIWWVLGAGALIVARVKAKGVEIRAGVKAAEFFTGESRHAVAAIPGPVVRAGDHAMRIWVQANWRADSGASPRAADAVAPTPRRSGRIIVPVAVTATGIMLLAAVIIVVVVDAVARRSVPVMFPLVAIGAAVLTAGGTAWVRIASYPSGDRRR